MFSSRQLLNGSSTSTPASLNEQIIHFLNREPHLKGWVFSAPLTSKPNTYNLKLSIQSEIDNIKPVEMLVIAEPKQSTLDATYRARERYPFPLLPKKLPAGKELVIYNKLSAAKISDTINDELPIQLLNNCLQKTTLLSLNSEGGVPSLCYLLLSNLCAPLANYTRVYNIANKIRKKGLMLDENSNFFCDAFSSPYNKQTLDSRPTSAGSTYRQIYRLILKKIHNNISKTLRQLKLPKQSIEIPKEINAFLNKTGQTSPNVENTIIQHSNDLFNRAQKFLSALDQTLKIQYLEKKVNLLTKNTPPLNSLTSETHPSPNKSQSFGANKLVYAAIIEEPKNINKSLVALAKPPKHQQETAEQVVLLNKKNTLLKKQIKILEEQNKLLTDRNALLEKYQNTPPTSFSPEQSESLKELASQWAFCKKQGTPMKITDLNTSMLSFLSNATPLKTPKNTKNSLINFSLFSNQNSPAISDSQKASNNQKT